MAKQSLKEQWSKFTRDLLNRQEDYQNDNRSAVWL